MNLRKIGVIGLSACALLFTACNKNMTWAEADNYVKNTYPKKEEDTTYMYKSYILSVDYSKSSGEYIAIVKQMLTSEKELYQLTESEINNLKFERIYGFGSESYYTYERFNFVFPDEKRANDLNATFAVKGNNFTYSTTIRDLLYSEGTSKNIYTYDRAGRLTSTTIALENAKTYDRKDADGYLCCTQTWSYNLP